MTVSLTCDVQLLYKTEKKSLEQILRNKAYDQIGVKMTMQVFSNLTNYHYAKFHKKILKWILRRITLTYRQRKWKYAKIKLKRQVFWLKKDGSTKPENYKSVTCCQILRQSCKIRVNVDQLTFDFMCDHEKVRSILYVNTKKCVIFYVWPRIGFSTLLDLLPSID